MKKTENAILKFFIKNVDLEIFKILTRKIFIISYVFFFSFGIYFIYQETRQCQIKGNFKLNPLYTPQKILDNEFFLIRSVTKNYPSIQWYKNKFEVRGPAKKNGTTFCQTEIVKFAKELEKKYVSVVNNSMAIYPENTYDLDDAYLEDEESLRNRAIIKRQRERDRNIALKQIERLINNPDKYTLDWQIIEQMDLGNIIKQLFLFSIYSFIFAIFFTTGVDLILLIRSHKK